MRYRVETYRGYEYVDEQEKALTMALQLVDDIAKDNPEHREVWWSKIRDLEGGRKKIIYMIYEGQKASTPWYI